MVGVVYRRGSQLLLSLGNGTLLTGDQGELTAVAPDPNDVSIPGATVGELCRAWGVDSRAVDAFVAARLPRPTPTPPPSRGRRRSRAERDHFWRNHRLRRLHAG